MRPGGHIVMSAAAKLYAPLMVLFGLSLLASHVSGDGVGFLAGLSVSLALVVHLMAAGAAAARAAFSPVLARAMLALGLIGIVLGTGAPNLRFAAQVVECSLFAITISAVSLIIAVLAGRAPTLRDEVQ